MAGRNFTVSEFRRVGREFLNLERIDLFPIGPGRVRESLPRVTLFRAADLLSVRLSFVGLSLTDGPDGKVLHRSAGATTGYLSLHFGGQHLHERAFFESSEGIKVATPASSTEQPPRPPDPDADPPSPQPPKSNETPLRPPVPTRIAGASRLVFRVTEERIPWSLEGILAAIGTLPLSVAPHAVAAPSFFLPPIIDLATPNFADLAEPGNRRVAGAIHSVSHTLGSAAALEARFGAAAAASALVAAHAGGGSFRLRDDAMARLEDVVGVRVTRFRRLPPAPREPTATETAIELPFRLQLSPPGDAGFAHATNAVASDTGRVELWHTRLGVRTDDGVDERASDGRTARAIWARDFDELPDFPFTPDLKPADPLKGSFPPANQNDDSPNWRSPLNSRDRMMLVHETSNFHLNNAQNRPYAPPSVDVDRLMLSSLGGWLASDFETDPPNGGPTIQEWVHRAALGRDNYVKVVYAGFLLPFLHPASLVKVTERKVRDGVAYLFQRMYVVVRNPLHTFGSTSETYDGGKIALAMPFTSVRILTPATPDIDAPNDISSVPGYMFTPFVGGAAFPFRMLGVDLDGRLVEFEGPLVFAEYDHNQTNPNVDETILRYTQHIPVLQLRGQKVAYAPSAAADDTSLATREMRFSLVTTPGIRARTPDQARMEPMLLDASAIVPAMNALAGADTPVTVLYPPGYLKKQFTDNAAEVFLQLQSAAPMDFTTQSDRSGGFVAPSLAVGAISRTHGPVGGTADKLIAGGAGFKPSDFFPATAMLFGLIPLRDLLPSGFNADALPRFLAQGLTAVTMLTTNLERAQDLASRLATGPVNPTQAAHLQAVDDDAQVVVDAVAALLGGGDDGLVAVKLAAIDTAVIAFRGALQTVIGDLATMEGPLRTDREALAATLGRLLDQVRTQDDVKDLLDLLQLAATGATLPETVRARLDWSTEVFPWPTDAPVFVPRGNKGTLALTVDVQAPTKQGAQPSAIVTCSISAFDLKLIGKVPFITLSFEKMEFSAAAGSKTDVNVVFSANDGVKFGGPLAFVETLRSIIPFDGFSDPPYLDVSAAGIRAGFDLAIPTVAMGVFALSNVTFSAAFEVPFIGESIAVRFAFSSREDPFRLQVAFFAGGGFFAIVITPKEVRELEAALEFGAAVALNFGVASGSVSVMAGIYFRLRTENGDTDAQLTGYFRARGEVDVLGLITACIEIYLELTYETKSGKAVGRASISVEVSVCMLSFSVSISCEKKFAGNEGDPTFEEVMGLHPLAVAGSRRPWDDYCDAFAG